MAAIQNANADVGAMVIELSEREYMVRGLGYLKSIGDIENVVVGATAERDPDPGRRAGPGRPSGRRCAAGIAELDGRGDAVGGIVVMRFGENALTTIQRRQGRSWPRSQAGLPPGVVVTPGVRPERPDRPRDREPARASCSRKA